jgi:hypothetical protein
LKQSEAMMGARGQIVWILALVLSTMTIIYLERLDIGAPEKPTPVSTRLAVAATEALATAEKRYEASPDSGTAAALAVALTAAVQAGVLGLAEGQARLAPLRVEAALAPEWPAVKVLADLTFGE